MLTYMSARQRRNTQRPAWVGASSALGTVKSFDLEAGYGWIKPDDGGPDVVVYSTAVRAGGLTSLHSGQRVQFAPQAARVEPAEGASYPDA